MFNKELKVITRLLNEDHLKVEKLVDTFKKSGTTIRMWPIGDGTVEIKFVSKKSIVNELEHDLRVLNLVGIEGRIEAK